MKFLFSDAFKKEEEDNFQKLSHLVHNVAFCSIKKKFEQEYTKLNIEEMLNEHQSHLSLTDEQMRILYSHSGTNICKLLVVSPYIRLILKTPVILLFTL